MISDVLLWRLSCPTKGSRPLTYPDTITRDTGIRLEALAGAMADKTQ